MYLYVDAAYLRNVFEARLCALLGRSIEINWRAVRTVMGAQRVFFYDCLDDIRKTGETNEAFQARQRAQEENLDAISSLDGFFVRLGTMRGDVRRRRQKEVDVLLAVDMLTHSHRRSTTHATLIAGDLDFKPVVDAVVEQGTVVAIAYDPRCGSRDLARAADSQRILTLRTLWSFSIAAYDSATAHFFPREYGYNYNVITKPVRIGSLKGSAVHLHKEPAAWVLNLAELEGQLEQFWSHPDEAMLLAFAREEFGEIKWAT